MSDAARPACPGAAMSEAETDRVEPATVGIASCDFGNSGDAENPGPLAPGWIGGMVLKARVLRFRGSVFGGPENAAARP